MSKKGGELWLTFWWWDEGPDEEEEYEDAEDDAEPLDQVHVGDLHRLGCSHPKDHWDPEKDSFLCFGGLKESFVSVKERNVFSKKYLKK